MEINKEHCSISDAEGIDEGISRKTVLPGDIEGIETHFIALLKGRSFQLAPEKSSISIFIATQGKGWIRQGKRQFKIDEPALFVPSVFEDVTIGGENENLGLVEIKMLLSETDLHYFGKQPQKLPYFIAYSQCKRYKESIKSEKTINRVLLPENLVPRLCIGSVETRGPDEVRLHAHPMLEQLFFGLTDNNCLVSADGHQALFEENTLLHIPLGSKHGVKVEEGKTLHYIWIDFFRSQEDMKYIKENHFVEGDL
jgi:hypothetical protein